MRLFGLCIIFGALQLAASSAAAQSDSAAEPLETIGQAEVPIGEPSPDAGNETAAAGADRPQLAAKPGDLAIGWKQIRELFGGMAGIPMWALVVCSVVLMMFVLERLVVLQKHRISPRTFTTRVIQHMKDDNLDGGAGTELLGVCREHGSPISRFFAIVLENRGRSAFEIRTAVSDQADSEIYHLRKHIRAIGALAQLAPLLGLFGTVIGMIDAFQALSQQQGAGKSEMLAAGISLALIATASGLGVAIVASVAYFYLQGKVDQRIQDLDVLTNQAVALMSSDARPTEGATKKRRPLEEARK